MSYKCDYCEKIFEKESSKNRHEKYCKKNPARLFISGFNNPGRSAWNKGITKEMDERIRKRGEKASKTLKGRTGRPHTEEEKRKISESRKLYLNLHPDKVPFKLNHSSKESYPETYFRKWLKKEKLFDKQEFSISRYTLDFAWPDKKIYLEIDGNQHKLDWMQKHDKDRTAYLDKLGWTCICRIDWSEYQKLNRKQKHRYLEKLKEAIVDAKFIEKFILATDKKILERAKLIEEGRVDPAGRVSHYYLSTEEWEDRLNKILATKVNFMKFGWKRKVAKLSGLTIFEVESTLKHFKNYFEGKVYIHKALGSKRK